MKRADKSSRRTQSQRRKETQDAVLSAAIKLLIDKGHGGFSASRVAAMAGVSRGALEHYFPTKQDLLAAATRHAMREAVEHAGMLARRAVRSNDPVAKFLMDSEHFFFSPRQILNNIWIDTLRGAGYPLENAQRFVELTTYMLRGIFMMSAWTPYDIDRAALVDTWRRLAPAALRLKIAPRAKRAAKRTRTKR
jgi:AcrR family transcriptional regulator